MELLQLPPSPTRTAGGLLRSHTRVVGLCARGMSTGSIFTPGVDAGPPTSASGPTTSEEDKKNADALKARMAASATNTAGASKGLGTFPAVKIDLDSKYKYVLIKATDPASGTDKTLVRGWNAPYHADVAAPTLEELEECGFTFNVLGGGRISHSSANKKISIFGFSYSFGQPDHSITADLCRTAFPGFECEWSNEGY